MRNGDTLSLGSINHTYDSPGPNDDNDNILNTHTQAYIKKWSKGIYYFTGLWTIPSKLSRSDIWTYGNFTINKEIITFCKQTSPESLRAFFLVCRYIKRLITSDRHNSYRHNRKIKPQDDWFYLNSIEFNFDGFWFNKNKCSAEPKIIRYRSENDKFIKNNAVKKAHIEINNDLLNDIYQQSTHALLNKSIICDSIQPI